MKPLKKASRQTMADVVELTEAGVRTVVGWPKAFFNVLDACRLDTIEGGGLCLLNDALPGLTRRVGRLRDRAWQAGIKSALGAYASSSLQTPLPIGGRNVPGVRPATVSEVARQLGVRTQRLIAELGRLPGVAVATRMTAAGRCRRIIGAAAIAEVRRAIREELSIKQAAKLISLSAARVRRLIGDELLVVNERRLSRTAVHSLRSALMAAGDRTLPPIDAITVGRALQFCIPVDQTTRFVESIVNGALAVHAPAQAGVPMQLLIGEAQVKAWASLQSGASRTWLTVRECAERLGLKQQVAYHLVRVGLIRTQTVRVSGRSMRVVTPADICEFEDTFVPLVGLASVGRFRGHRAQECATASGLDLVSGPTIDGGRQYFVRISAAEKLLPPHTGSC